MRCQKGCGAALRKNEVPIISRQPINRNAPVILDETKKIEEKNEFPEGSQEAIFCQKLKDILRGAIKAWNRYQKGEKIDEDLIGYSPFAIAKRARPILSRNFIIPTTSSFPLFINQVFIS